MNRKNIKIVLAAVCFTVMGLAPLHAVVYTFTPEPRADLWELGHDNFYTWAINWTVPFEKYHIKDAVLTFKTIWNSRAGEENYLYTHLLSSEELPVPADNIVIEGSDKGTTGDNFDGMGTQIGTWSDPLGGSPAGSIDLIYRFSELPGMLETLETYLSAGYFGFGIDPDCHYFNQGVTFQVDVVPEPSTSGLFLLTIFGLVLQFSRKRYEKFRKFIDIVFSSMVIVITLPISIIIAILIKTESPGPVIYKQKRVGLNRRKKRGNRSYQGDRRKANRFGNLFYMYKFRTMYNDAESKSGAVWANVNDNRITKIGKFLRLSRLDELPQFFNVLKGDMSIIGPRPERPEFVRDLNKSICSYYLRYRIKPGITGLAQVRYSYAASIRETRKKLKYDLLYLKTRCLAIDVRIFFATVGTVLFARGSR
ncbi:sugar transferase [Elusimicrobiota bacterium]